MAMKINVGRPKGSLCWEYFQYDQVAEVCKCLITVGDTECGKIIKGKNTTNLKRHLEVMHKPEYQKVGAFDVSNEHFALRAL